MKQVVAYIKSNKLPAVTLALHKLEGLDGMSFSAVRGFGSDRIPKSDPIIQPLVDYAPYTRLEVFCNDDQVSEIVWIISNAAHTGQKGDGEIYVLDVCRTIRIQAEYDAGVQPEFPEGSQPDNGENVQPELCNEPVVELFPEETRENLFSDAL